MTSVAPAAAALGPSALWYAKNFNWPVFPLHGVRGGKCTCGVPSCGSAGKHPRTKAGFKDAATDPATIERWWAQWPDANIGIATGRQSFVAADIDPRNGGDETAEDWRVTHGPMPDTVVALTGGGGLHYYFAPPPLPAGQRIASGRIGRGIDCKADGGYVVAPPSQGVDRPYMWEGSSRPNEIAPAELPPWLLRMLTIKSPKAKPVASGGPDRGALYRLFESQGLVRRILDAERAAVTCVRAEQHTTSTPEETDTSTVVFTASGGGKGWYHCSHTSHGVLALPDVLACFPPDVVRSFGFETSEKPPTVSTDPGDWTNLLDQRVKAGGGVTYPASARNAATILAHDPRWRGVIAGDTFQSRIVTLREPPWHDADKPAAPWTKGQPWSDEDTTLVILWLSRVFGMNIGRDPVAGAIDAVGKRNPWHPVQAYLDSLAWDGAPRLARWAEPYLGAAVPASVDAARLWLIACVARVFDPGCKSDHVLVLEAPQGARKSSALEALCPDSSWYVGGIGDIRSKDAALNLRGKWIVELGELVDLLRVDPEVFKSFCTTRVDTYRAPYGRHSRDVPRQSCFGATTNDDTYSIDRTGARRLWPVKCGRIDLDAIIRDRDQLWAEAVAEYRDGKPWWPDDGALASALASEMRARVRADEALTESLATWLAKPGVGDEISLRDALLGLGFDLTRVTRADEMRLGLSFIGLGWARARVRRHGGRVYVYTRPLAT